MRRAAFSAGQRGIIIATSAHATAERAEITACAQLLSQLCTRPQISDNQDKRLWPDIQRSLAWLHSPVALQARCYATRKPPRPMPPPPPRKSGSGIPGVKHIVAVSSGKGGVGKSTTAANLAVALAAAGKLRVGLLDVDVFGPSLPRIMGVNGKPPLDADGLMQPLEAHGVQCMSMGFLMSADRAASWRGPMVMSAVQTLTQKVAWAPLDVLILDMPPGTGDAQISIGQLLRLAGALIVTTPQDLALIDARRGITLFRTMKVPLLGLVENMSTYVCPACGHVDQIFGEDGGCRTAAELGLELLAQVPLNAQIQQLSDAGTPIVISDPTSPPAKTYRDLAERISAKLRFIDDQMVRDAELGAGAPPLLV